VKPQQSKFAGLSKKQLTLICEKLVDEEFPIGNPYDWGFDSAFEILKDISKYFSIDVNAQEDVEFFSKFLEINEDIIADLFANNREQMRNVSLIEKLQIPTPSVYIVNYDVDGSCTYTEYLSNTFSSYDESWVEDAAKQGYDDGNWDLYEGKVRAKTEYDNFEMNDYNFESVHRYYEKPKQIKDSILNKLVVENTSEVIDSLDKDTLLKLKRMIDSKLRLI
jgi:hypothetical protein